MRHALISGDTDLDALLAALPNGGSVDASSMTGAFTDPCPALSGLGSDASLICENADTLFEDAIFAIELTVDGIDGVVDDIDGTVSDIEEAVDDVLSAINSLNPIGGGGGGGGVGHGSSVADDICHIVGEHCP